MPDWIAALNDTVLSAFRTRLVGGFDEPFYLAFRADGPAEIRFTRDYTGSALHELAHWCVAGEARRRQDDYGYWYAPDGRTNAQQQQFFQVEVTPQAVENISAWRWAFPLPRVWIIWATGPSMASRHSVRLSMNATRSTQYMACRNGLCRYTAACKHTGHDIYL